jgi:hypothetical protein
MTASLLKNGRVWTQVPGLTQRHFPAPHAWPNMVNRSSLLKALAICLTSILLLGSAWMFRVHEYVDISSFPYVKTPKHHVSTGPMTPIIWQTWINPKVHSLQDVKPEYQNYTRGWMEQNPRYRYELLTKERAESYVELKYKHRPDLIRLYERISDPILAADFIRYLAVFADGGVYSDMDTECIVPVDDWVPEKYKNHTGMIVGLEFDAGDEDFLWGFDTRTSMCQWTFAASPGHPVMEKVVETVAESLMEFGRVTGSEQIAATQENGGEVLFITGPRVCIWQICQTPGNGEQSR